MHVVGRKLTPPRSDVYGAVYIFMSVKVNGRPRRCWGVTYFAIPVVCFALTTQITVVVV